MVWTLLRLQLPGLDCVGWRELLEILILIVLWQQEPASAGTGLWVKLSTSAEWSGGGWTKAINGLPCKEGSVRDDKPADSQGTTLSAKILRCFPYLPEKAQLLPMDDFPQLI